MPRLFRMLLLGLLLVGVMRPAMAQEPPKRTMPSDVPTIKIPGVPFAILTDTAELDLHGTSVTDAGLKKLAHEAVGVDRGRPSSVRTMPATPTLLYAHWKTATYWWR